MHCSLATSSRSHAHPIIFHSGIVLVVYAHRKRERVLLTCISSTRQVQARYPRLSVYPVLFYAKFRSFGKPPRPPPPPSGPTSPGPLLQVNELGGVAVVVLVEVPARTVQQQVGGRGGGGREGGGGGGGRVVGASTAAAEQVAVEGARRVAGGGGGHRGGGGAGADSAGGWRRPGGGGKAAAQRVVAVNVRDVAWVRNEGGFLNKKTPKISQFQEANRQKCAKLKAHASRIKKIKPRRWKQANKKSLSSVTTIISC